MWYMYKIIQPEKRRRSYICSNIDLEGIMLNEVSQIEKEMMQFLTNMRHLEKKKNPESIETESRIVVSRDLEVGELGRH